jgi:phosphatidylglycerophosphate synthase
MLLPSLIILGVDFGDFLDGVVARYWLDQSWIDSVGKDIEDDQTDSTGKKKKDEEEPVVDKESWIVAQRHQTYGGFIDAVCDKAFLIPCWISLLSCVPGSEYMRIVQYIVLWCLILTETVSGCIRFKAYYTSNGIAAPSVKGLDFSTSAVKVCLCIYVCVCVCLCLYNIIYICMYLSSIIIQYTSTYI